MLSIFIKEVNGIFSSLIGYMVIGLFLLLMGLMLWVFPDYSILNYNYASLQQLFDIAPIIFLFLIPAITMRSFAEETQSGTIELLATRPLSDWAIIFGKFFAGLLLVAFSLSFRWERKRHFFSFFFQGFCLSRELCIAAV